MNNQQHRQDQKININSFNPIVGSAPPVVSITRDNKNVTGYKEIINNDNLDNSLIVDYIINNNIDFKNSINIKKKEIENNIKNNYINDNTINNFILINNILHMRLNKKKYVRYDMKKYAKFINNFIKETNSKHPRFDIFNKCNIIRIKNYLHSIIRIWFREKEIREFVIEYKILDTLEK
jgi:hypothetical protein